MGIPNKQDDVRGAVGVALETSLWSTRSMKFLSGSTKVWLSLAGVSLVLLIFGYELGGRLGLLISFLITVTFHCLVYFYGESPLLTFVSAKAIEGQDPWGLQGQLRRHSALLQIEKPDLYFSESLIPFAFSLGHSWQPGTICVSLGLLQKLEPNEVEAVIAHQVCHVQRLNTYGFGLVHVMAFAVVGLGRWLDQSLPRQAGVPLGRQWFSRILSPLAWLFLRSSLREKIYFQNDELAAALLKDRQALAQALWKMDGMCQAMPMTLPPWSGHFFIVSPAGFAARNSLLRVHPKIDIRIQKLIGFFPI
jgi:heat shock protein HtpX